MSSRPCLPYVGDVANGRAPWLHGHYSASSLLRTRPPPSRLRPPSRCRRLYGLPCSGDFSPGRGRLLQLLDMSLSPCRRFHPAEMNSRVGQCSAAHVAFALRLKARPSDLLIFEATTRLLLLRPGDSLISPREILSIGFVGSGWDRDRAHPAVGEGFPILLFRLQAGSQSHHCVCFSKPPYNAGRPDFPGPV